MTVAHFVKIHAEVLNLLSQHDIKINDFKYVNLYADYEEMIANGNKVSYSVVYLARKYNISEASVYRLLKRLKSSI